MLVQSQTLRCSGEHPGESSLARTQRLKPKVITIELDQVEGPHEYSNSHRSTLPGTNGSPGAMRSNA